MPMTVEELIAELSKQPNRRVPVIVRCLAYDEDDGEMCVQRLDVDGLRWDGGCVIVEAS